MSELACIPYGVGEDHGGVCIQTRLGSYRILFDCGILDVSRLAIAKDQERLQDLVAGPPDFVFCSHAHPDHAQGLLVLHAAYPRVPIFASEVTVQLLPLNWLGETQEVPADLCQALPWRTPIEIADGLTVQLWPSGHLPGAACFLVTYRNETRSYSVFYTGDFFLSNSRLVEGLPLEELRGLKPDVLIVEGSYGTARYPHRRQQENRLAETIYQLIQSGRSVLLPTPTLGIGQELVMLLRSHHHFTGQNLTVWVDPIVAAGCDRYLDLMSHFPSSVQNFARHQSLFWDERILPRVRPISAKGTLELDAPCIVIAHRAADLSRYCRGTTNPWTILLPESFATTIASSALGTATDSEDESTLDWLQALSAELESGDVQLDTYLLTTHSDGTGTTQLIHNLRPQHVIFFHGNANYLADLASLEEMQSRYQLHLPTVGQVIELPLGDRFLQPAAPELVYEGEMTEADDGVWLLLSERITADPRWQRFADTGIVQARWQGEDLLIQSMSQQNLLEDISTARPVARQDNCQSCEHMRNQRCWNMFSPLYGRKVAPDGYCPAFTPKSEAC